MEEMQLHNMSWIEVQFLKKAVDVLCQCRQTLMYTYVFAFYLCKNNQSIIFEVRISLWLASEHWQIYKLLLYTYIQTMFIVLMHTLVKHKGLNLRSWRLLGGKGTVHVVIQ